MLTVLITGANRGLGYALAEVYAQAGWRVFACCRDPAQAKDLLNLAQHDSAKFTLFKLNVESEQDLKKLVDDLALASIDVLINNAGVYGPTKLRFGDVDAQSWLDVVHVNTIAPLLISQALIANVATSERRTIINISSKMGSINDNTEGNAYIYRSSKAGLNMVTRSMALDLANQQVTVVALDPGWVRTGVGGEHAPMEPRTSAVGLKRVIDYLTLDDSGSFFDFRGEEVPW